jgi:hypothetical protein
MRNIFAFQVLPGAEMASIGNRNNNAEMVVVTMQLLVDECGRWVLMAAHALFQWSQWLHHQCRIQRWVGTVLSVLILIDKQRIYWHHRHNVVSEMTCEKHHDERLIDRDSGTRMEALETKVMDDD